MVGDLAGRTAFITGGSSGIGLGLAHLLADAGMNVAIGYRSIEHRDTAIAGFDAGHCVIPIEVDIADRDSLARAAIAVSDRFGKLHFLACNAGVFLPASLIQTTHDDWDWEIGINLTGTFNTLKAFLPLLLGHGEPAHIVATGSILGLLGAKAAPAYAASKFGVVGLMESLAAELEDSNVGVTIFSPGFVNTNVADWRRSRSAAAASGGIDANPSTWTDPALTMNPLTAAKHLLDAVRSDRLHAIPNWEYGPAISARSKVVAEGIGNESPQSHERKVFGEGFYERSIYSRILGHYDED